ncbi:MAG: hypothetical protein IKF71_00705 [Bacilli bacterium]|nr:hypothetical protein [Bacilli bacterium]
MRKKKNTRLIIVLLVLAIGIGYAYLNSNLALNGSTGISGNEWDVHFENLISTKSSGTTCTNYPTIDSTDTTTITYNCTFNQPGDYIEMTVDAVNAGTIDAMISDEIFRVNGNDNPSLPSYFDTSCRYGDGVFVDLGQTLPANSQQTYKIRITYNPNASELPTTDQTFSVEAGLVYAQVDENAVPRTSEVYVVNDYAEDQTEFVIGEYFPDNITTYSSAQNLVTATGKTVFLKLGLSGHRIQTTTVGMMINNTAYYFQEGIPEEDPYTGNYRSTYYAINKANMENWKTTISFTCEETNTDNGKQYSCADSTQVNQIETWLFLVEKGSVSILKEGNICAAGEGRSLCTSSVDTLP